MIFSKIKLELRLQTRTDVDGQVSSGLVSHFLPVAYRNSGSCEC